MSHEPGLIQRSSTPLSGRSTPLSRVRVRNSDEVQPKDKSYRRYASGIERALSSFETAQHEWADYISFLGRLLKALQARPADVHAIPDADVVATRLSQCLNPTLPSGVHQKALEVYGYIFSVYDGNELGKNIHLYLPGLSPVLSFASLSVRPYYLALFDNYLLPLGFTALRSTLKALILSLLPGLEDETSEDFDRILATLDNLRGGVHAQNGGAEQFVDQAQLSFFWQCFFLATVTNSSRRQGALAFLSRKMPVFGPKTLTIGTRSRSEGHIDDLSKEARAAIHPEPGLLIRAIAVGLTDKQLLVQRGFLDLLVTHLPLHSVVLQQAIGVADLDRLVAASMSVVIRRDMSLNRRLWSWLLGPEGKDNESVEQELNSPVTAGSTTHAAYFSQFGLKPLNRSVMALLSRATEIPSERAKPFRVLLSFMDRWEIGGLLVPDIFIPAIESAYNYSLTAPKQDVDEVLKSASNFFDGVESALIWAKFLELGTSALSPSSLDSKSRIHNLRLCSFIIQRFNLREEEMLTVHIPLMALPFILSIRERLQALTDTQHKLDEVLLLALDIAEKLIALAPDRSFAEVKGTELSSAAFEKLVKASSETLLKMINQFYNDEQSNLENVSPPFPSFSLGQLLVIHSSTLFLTVIESDQEGSGVENCTRILCSALQKVPKFATAFGAINVASSLQTIVERENLNFKAVFGVVYLITTIHFSSGEEAYLNASDMGDLQHALVKQLWMRLDPFNARYHVEAVRSLWMLNSVTPASRQIESFVSTALVRSMDPPQPTAVDSGADAGRRFAVLWTHSIQEKTPQTDKGPRGLLRRASSMSTLAFNAQGNTDVVLMLVRPLFLLLDNLASDGTEVGSFVKGWLQNLPSLRRVFEILVDRIIRLKCVHSAIASAKISTGITTRRDTSSDSAECLYYLQHVFRILQNASEHVWLTILAECLPPSSSMDGADPSAVEVSIQTALGQTCLMLLDISVPPDSAAANVVVNIHQVALNIIQSLIDNPYSTAVVDLDLDNKLLDRLHASIDTANPVYQSTLLDTIRLALKSRLIPTKVTAPTRSPIHSRKPSTDTVTSKPTVSKLTPPNITLRPTTSPLLLTCLKAGFSSSSSHINIDGWVSFLIDVLPLFMDSIFQSLIPLVECFCKQIEHVYAQLKSTFELQQTAVMMTPESTLLGLFNGLEQVLARAHERLLSEEGRAATPRVAEQPQNFLSGMVQGVFSTDTPSTTRSTTANSRLTVVLCFKDAVRTAFNVWCWGLSTQEQMYNDSSSLASFNYTSLRMRNRARRLLEHLFAAEPLECVETLTVFWCHPPRIDFPSNSIMSLLNGLSGSRPRQTMLALFNGIYSRTNPSALDNVATSSLASELSETDLGLFLMEYTLSIDDDAIDEIWTDCLAFLKDVLSNPMPNRQILPILLQLTTIIAEKADNTNFGEDKKMRKELSDTFFRLLTATFTTRPQGTSSEATHTVGKKDVTQPEATNRVLSKATDVISTLATICPKLPLVLTTNELVTSAGQSISLNVIGPTIRAKAFPNNISKSFADLVYQLTKLPQISRFWRRDLLDAFNDNRFFSITPRLLQDYWFLPLRQLIANDKDRVPELLARMSPPTTAGIVFGVGATSARMEADRKTQLNLRRIALAVLVSPRDTHVTHIALLEEKIVELFTATAVSSPSTASWPEIFMVFRALALRTSAIHFATLWPVINRELQSAILSITKSDGEAESKYSNATILQACKLLDTLVTLNLDDFQLYEWLYLTDTIDAVYRPTNVDATSLADEVAEVLGDSEAGATAPFAQIQTLAGETASFTRRPILDRLLDDMKDQFDLADLKSMPKQEFSRRVLRPYFGQLSLLNFEATYAGHTPDVERCTDGLVQDLCDGGSGMDG